MKSNRKNFNIKNNLIIAMASACSVGLLYRGYQFTAAKIEESRPEIITDAIETRPVIGESQSRAILEEKKQDSNSPRTDGKHQNGNEVAALSRELQNESNAAIDAYPDHAPKTPTTIPTPEQVSSTQAEGSERAPSNDFELQKEKLLQELSQSKLSQRKAKKLSDAEFQNEIRRQELERNALSHFTQKDYQQLKIQFPEVTDFKELAMIKYNRESDTSKLGEAIRKPKKQMTEAERLQKEQEELKKIRAEMGMPAPLEKLAVELYDPWANELEKISSQEEQAALQAARQALEARRAEAKMRKKAAGNTESTPAAVPE